MAGPERREGYKGGFDWQTLQDRREEELTLENVPGFQRPMAAGPMDQISGVDELTGRPVFQTAIGTEYTVRRNPDQRTARQKAEDWYYNGAQLPTMAQVGEVAASLPGAVYDAARESVAGTATLGDAMGFVPAVGAVGATQRLPEGAIPIFGGRRAQSFGQELALRRELPTSVGADGLDRFEIDDSLSYIGEPRNLTTISNANSPLPKDHTVLSDVLAHEELFLQYPDLADLPVVLDMSLFNKEVQGYFWPERGYMALNPRLLNKPNELQDTLFHEIQHAVQNIEGFDHGTNPHSPNVEQRLDTQRNIAAQDFSEDMSRYLRGLEEVPPDWSDYDVTDYTRDLIYRTNQGEVEADNTVKRLGLNLSKRKEIASKDTEGYPRDLQWRNSDDHSFIRPRGPQ
jgi:hypothetical protein